MKKQLFIVLFSLALSGYSQDRKNEFFIQNDDKHELLVSFEVADVYENVFEYYYQENDIFKQWIDSHSISLEIAFEWDEEHFEKLCADARRLSESDASVRVLKGFYIVQNDFSNDELYELAQGFEEFSFVRYAELNSSAPIPPPHIDIPPVTPDFSGGQGYIQANPGVNMQYAWNQGIFGQGIRVRDVEYGMSVTHEELTHSKFSNQSGIHSSVTSAWIDHGTATAGVVAAHNGSYGVTGMQHGISEFKVYPEYTPAGYNRLRAVNTAISQSTAGDVIIYEMQTSGVNGNQTNPNYVPAEYVNSIWDVTKAAVDAGIHIVAAAGNGNQNLDSPAYASYRNRGDSGALIVGAGSSNTTHSRLNFSTYGQRVNVQGWGHNVLTTGYGNYQKIANDPNQSYTMFSGTSSATPVVASCVIALLTRANQDNVALTPAQVRNILITTGIPQGGAASQHIGPLPNMQSALNYLENQYLSDHKVNVIPVTLYPNPAETQLFLSFPQEFSENKVLIFDLTGRKILELKDYKSEEPINVSHLKKGTYMLKMESKNTIQTKKVMIK